MDKFQAIQQFWSSFGIPAYDENTVPDDAEMPYITYSTSIDSVGSPVLITGSLWYYSFSWEEISRKTQTISDFIGYGYHIIKIDGGYLYITRGSPFAQRVAGGENDAVRRVYINLMCEFLTAC